MEQATNRIDSVRASHDGHEYHEAWTARKSLQLLFPNDNLVGIAVEGLSPTDQSKAAAETVEIADITIYKGKNATFQGADKVKIVQFKYSNNKGTIEFRASDFKKTIKKFAGSYLDFIYQHGSKKVGEKLTFELITNRPIYSPLIQAIDGIAKGKVLTGNTKKQAEQFKATCGLKDNQLAEFASKCNVVGLSGNLENINNELAQTIVNWSATSGYTAGSRIGQIRKLVRDKAGSKGNNRNVIRDTDVLDAMQISDRKDLLPCPESLPEVGNIIEREQLPEAVKLSAQLDKPLVIHAAGGIGKTVFMDSLAKTLSEQHEVVFFDCFGGGEYRKPGDARHQPKRGLVHIINSLACKGLCDPLLPDNPDVDAMISAFWRRIKQCVDTIATASAKRQLILIIDAIDNASIEAKDRREDSFPTLLLQSFQDPSLIPSVRLIVSSRTERLDLSVDDAPHEKFRLKPFSPSETEKYLKDRVQEIKTIEIKVAQARSGGNARVLEHLVKSDRGFLDPSEINKKIELDELLNNRIKEALSEALARGYKKDEVNAFLAGLAVLPPPIPLDEYANAHGMDISTIESFAADLAPLLERTKYGLVFRDEPTETLIRTRFVDPKVLRHISRNLFKKQDSSVYAARALPGLLQMLEDGKQLFKLAFDDRFPEAISGTVGKRNIRLDRVKAAVHHAAANQNYNHLVRLLVELSTISAVNQRGNDYILDNPDLVIEAQDVDATRRLFEIRSKWPGAKHARRAIASVLSNDLDEADRNAVNAEDWILHYLRQDHDHNFNRIDPERIDIAAIPFCLIANDRASKVVDYMRGWKEWFVFEVGELIFCLLEQVRPLLAKNGREVNEALESSSSGIGFIASALSFLELNDTQRNDLILWLSKACNRADKLEFNDMSFGSNNFRLQDGLVKASAIASSLGLHRQALKICKCAPHARPNVWSFQGPLLPQNILPFLSFTVLNAIVKGKKVREKDILPLELYEICKSMRGPHSGSEFRDNLKKRMNRLVKQQNNQTKTDLKTIDYKLQNDAEDFINNALETLLSLTNVFSSLLISPDKKGDKSFKALLKVWEEIDNNHDRYATRKYNRVFQLLGRQLSIFGLWARRDLKKESVEKLIKLINRQEIIKPSTLISVVSILAKRGHLKELAGMQALKIKALIDDQDDVDTRASLYADLARAILPASKDEATVYFKAGLDQMDAIGSGDYQFANELLLLAGSINGEELEDRDFHTLTNIWELNIPYDEEKSSWFAFAKGLSNTSGCKALAKLARWDDRSKVSLKYTLLPYLTALVQNGKSDPEEALALNWLAEPAELFECNSATFAQALFEKCLNDRKSLVKEVIRQFEKNNHGVPMLESLEALSSIADDALGKDSETSKHLSEACEQFKKVRDERNEQMNYRRTPDPQLTRKAASSRRQNEAKLKKLASMTIPTDKESLQSAIDEINNLQNVHDLKEECFRDLREKVLFSNRSQYMQSIAELENLDIYTKLAQLKICKEEWGNSSAAVSSSNFEMGKLILRLHAKDLSNSNLFDIANFCGIHVSLLATELIKTYASSNYSTEASEWLGLASILCEKADSGEDQKALIRLLNSDAAELSSSVPDGKWVNGIYPSDNSAEIASGLVWRVLGSPYASERWRAAHSVRCFAEFNRWEVIDSLVNNLNSEDAGPFQAPELRFFYMHAKLWLLIALARIAKDYPDKISLYELILSKISLDQKFPHVLMRHFASQALLTCFERGSLKLSAPKVKQLRDINLSPFPRLREKIKKPGENSIYFGRPDSAPKPKHKVGLDYDFEKNDVQSLSNVFGIPGWTVKDMLAEVIFSFDQAVKNMYDSGGREIDHKFRMDHMTTQYHTYGQQLGWHSQFIVAGRLLQKHPVTDDCYNDEPWHEWLKRNLLTRKDGLWLSDGLDKAPLTVQVNLLEKVKDSLGIIGNKDKLLDLAGISNSSKQDITVKGTWKSPDNIQVFISSALVDCTKAKHCAQQLIAERPYFVWLPTLGALEISDEKDCAPWIFTPSNEEGIDEDDPLGEICVERRPRFSRKIIKAFSLSTDDPFGRVWKKPSDNTVAYADAWGNKGKYEDSESNTGIRLRCSRDFLKEVLTSYKSDLLILIKLQRYKESTAQYDSEFSNTLAVVRIKKNMGFEYYKGAVNMLHISKE